jgi:hypothetical protein
VPGRNHVTQQQRSTPQATSCAASSQQGFSLAVNLRTFVNLVVVAAPIGSCGRGVTYGIPRVDSHLRPRLIAEYVAAVAGEMSRSAGSLCTLTFGELSDESVIGVDHMLFESRPLRASRQGPGTRPTLLRREAGPRAPATRWVAILRRRLRVVLLPHRSRGARRTCPGGPSVPDIEAVVT